MISLLIKFREFINQIENDSNGVILDSFTTAKLDKFLNNDMNSLLLKDIERRKANIFNDAGIIISKDQEYLFFLSTYQIRWYRPEKKPKEGILAGGTYINGVIDAFRFESPFWEHSLNKFNSLGLYEMFEMPENLRWIESPSAFLDAENTPHYGCFKLVKNQFPKEFYFFDNGLLYQLPFQSFEDYFSAQLACGMVKCWQYFYIDPNVIIEKNKNIPYMTWSLHQTSYLHENIRDLNFRSEIKNDRLDLIIEYMRRCIDLLPNSFPFIDFSYQIKRLKELLKLYDEL